MKEKIKSLQIKNKSEEEKEMLPVAKFHLL